MTHQEQTSEPQTSEAQPPQPPQYISNDDIMFHMALGKRQEHLEAAMNIWAAHLMEKYGLSRNDGVAPDGRIVRNVANPDDAQTQNTP